VHTKTRLHTYDELHSLIPEIGRNHSFLHSLRNENAKNDARSSEIKISFGSKGGIDQSQRGLIIGAATLA